MKVFVTGAAGFIGFHTAKALLEQGASVFGYDNINGYYDPKFKESRLKALHAHANFRFQRGDLEDAGTLGRCWNEFQPEYVIHLAAQAGVRYSIENPQAYVQSNLVGFQNVIELARATRPKNFVYASSSSVYGDGSDTPSAEHHRVDNPISLYAATKVSNELVAKTYTKLFGLSSVGLRFFTVYGPYSRPDMSIFKFSLLMKEGRPIPVFNEGNMVRDFTYIADIVEGILLAMRTPGKSPVYNLGKGTPQGLMHMIHLLEDSLRIKAKLEFLPMQQGDVHRTYADVSLAAHELGYNPRTSLEEGIPRFADWFLSAARVGELPLAFTTPKGRAL